jgi:hypothetical protein
MGRKRAKVKYKKYKKERVILSDVLPYELPLTFSNRYFYEFLLKNRVEYRDGSIFWKKDDNAIDATMCLLSGVPSNTSIVSTQISVQGQPIQENTFQNVRINFTSIPFGYKIRHKEDDFRELTICHPRNQLQLISWYDNYKELILAHCGVSPFSIRRPTRISRYVFHKDTAHYRSLSGEPVGVEEFDKEYENLRSFFVYKDYSHIFKFYESYKFHRCEKKYNRLLKLDIAKCFDSIYSHSLPWALYGKGAVKECLAAAKKALDQTFGGKFDKMMQQINYGETNGIIIGPEFSRIFAELIVQCVDRSLCVELQRDHQCSHKSDYEIFRFVDDYFVFYNDEKIKDIIVQALQLKLKDYKLSLNKSKAQSYDKPIITNISMAKHRIAGLLDEQLAFEIKHGEVGNAGPIAVGEKPSQKIGSIRVDANRLITQFKTIIKECDVDYKDTLN